jgi:hypothetical protein
LFIPKNGGENIEIKRNEINKNWRKKMKVTKISLYYIFLENAECGLINEC